MWCIIVTPTVLLFVSWCSHYGSQWFRPAVSSPQTSLPCKKQQTEQVPETARISAEENQPFTAEQCAFLLTADLTFLIKTSSKHYFETVIFKWLHCETVSLEAANEEVEACLWITALQNMCTSAISAISCSAFSVGLHWKWKIKNIFSAWNSEISTSTYWISEECAINISLFIFFIWQKISSTLNLQPNTFQWITNCRYTTKQNV